SRRPDGTTSIYKFIADRRPVGLSLVPDPYRLACRRRWIPQMWTKWILTVALLTLMPVMASSSGSSGFHVTAPGPERCQCAKGPGKILELWLHCDGKRANFEVGGHYPKLARRIYALAKSSVRFRQGRWYDDEFQAYIVGDTDLERDPPVCIG